MKYIYVKLKCTCRPPRCSSQVSEIYLAAILHTLHTIWWARNSRFSSINTNLHPAKIRIHSCIAMTDNVSKGNCLSSDFSFLDSFAVSPHSRRVKEIIQVLWKTPIAPWLKVNTDGSMVGGYVACGGLFRDYLGTFRGAFFCNVGVIHTLNVSRKFSMCIIFSTGYIKIYNINSTNEYLYNNTRSYNQQYNITRLKRRKIHL